MQTTKKISNGDVTTGDNSNVTTGDDSNIVAPTNGKSTGGITIGDVILKINTTPIVLDNAIVTKLLEIIEMLHANQILLMTKIDLIEISILEMNKTTE